MLAEIAPIDDAGLLILSAALVLIIAVAQLAQYLGTWLLSAWVGERLVLLFRNGLFRHMQRMSVAYHDRRGVADLSFRIQYDANSIQDVLIDGLIPLVGYIVTVIAMIYVIALIDVRLATIALVVAPVMFLLARQSRRPLRRRWDRVFAARSGAMSVVQEVLGSMRVVKAFGQERREETRFSARSFDAAKSHMLAIAAEGGVKLMLGVTGAVGTALVLVVGVFAVQAGTLTLGELLVVMAYLLMLYEPLREISPKIADIQSSLSNAERFFTILDEAPDVEEAAKPRAIERWSAVIAPSGSRTAA
jgi:ATP-binding cassette subfamily B protein